VSETLPPVRDATLLDLLDRVIDHGVVLTGSVTISVADVDLIYLELRLLLATVERAQRLIAGQSGPSNSESDRA
jgi:hypothetical protein